MSVKKVLLKDIAREAGVSVTLVSLVLSGKEKEHRIGKEIAGKVRRIAKEMNYQPNFLAQSLRNGRTHTIGLVVADIANPFFAQLARAIEYRANESGYSVIFANSNEDLSQFREIIFNLRSKHVDGLIIVPTENSQQVILRLQQENAKFVLLDRYFPQIDTSYVAVDNYSAAYRATRLLIGKGCKSPLMITYNSTLIHMEERERGFRDAIREAGIENESAVEKVCFSSLKEDIERIIKSKTLGNKKHDSFFFATNTLSLHGLRQLYTENRQVKTGKVEIVSFDYNETFDFISPPIPYLRQPINEMGSKAVNILIDSIENRIENTIKKTLQAELIA